jgi:hypothetical protein
LEIGFGGRKFCAAALSKCGQRGNPLDGNQLKAQAVRTPGQCASSAHVYCSAPSLGRKLISSRHGKGVKDRPVVLQRDTDRNGAMQRCPGHAAATVQRKSVRRSSVVMVPGEGVEPSRYCYRRILSPLRLPFRHPGCRSTYEKISSDVPSIAAQTCSRLLPQSRGCLRGSDLTGFGSKSAKTFVHRPYHSQKDDVVDSAYGDRRAKRNILGAKYSGLFRGHGGRRYR